MKSKDYLITLLAPFALLWIPLLGNLALEGWDWSLFDFVLMYCLMSGTTFIYRLLVTRQWSNLTYRLGAGVAVAAGFLMTWVNLGVQIIGDDNPAFVLYFLAALIGLVGVGLSRFHPMGMAKAAFATAGAIFLIPVIALLCWPTDFHPGPVKVFVLNGGFVAMFAVAGLLFRHAAGQRLPANP